MSSEDIDRIVGEQTDYWPAMLRFTGAGNLCPDSGWEWYKAQGTRWTVGEAWLIQAVTASMVAKRGRYRAVLGNPAVALDTFTRSVVDGWGTADTGGAYTGTDADFDVNGSEGTISGAANVIKEAVLPVLARDVDATLRVSFGAIPVGGPARAFILLRRTDNNNVYRFEVRLNTDGTIGLLLLRVVAGVGTQVGATINNVITGYVPGEVISMRAAISGAWPTTLRLRAWRTAEEEPTTWALDEADSSAVLQGAAGLSLRALTDAAVTNGPIVYGFDGLAAYEIPFTVVRDTYSRSVVDGWGSANTGGAYSLVGTAANFDVNSTQGTISVVAATGYSALLNGISKRDVESLVRFRVGTLPNAGVLEFYVMQRYTSLSSTYRVRVTVDSAGVVKLQLWQAGTGIGTEATLGFTVTAADFIWLRVVTDGASPTTYRARAWKDGSAEPGAWDRDVTDSTGPQAAAAVGLRAFGGAYTNGPILVTVDDYSVAASASALAMDTAYLAAGVQQVYSLAEACELAAVSGIFRTQLREYDASKVLLQTQDLIVYDFAAEWPSVEVGRYAASGAAPPVGVPIDVELHANTRHVKIRRVPDADAVGQWIIAAQGVLDGPQAQLASSPEASAESFLQADAAGALIRGGGIRVENDGAVVIIDGTSDHFKIAASGTITVPTAPPGGIATNGVNVFIGQANPAVVAMVSNGAGDNSRALGINFWDDAAGQAFVGVGNKAAASTVAWVDSRNNGDLVTADITLFVGNFKAAGSISRTCRYYALKEAAL
jgi:hypothetical protein